MKDRENNCHIWVIVLLMLLVCCLAKDFLYKLLELGHSSDINREIFL